MPRRTNPAIGDPASQLPHDPAPGLFHLGRPVGTEYRLERRHHRQVELVEYRRLDPEPDMVHPFDLDQVGAVSLVAEEIQQAFDRHLEHLASH